MEEASCAHGERPTQPGRRTGHRGRTLALLAAAAAALSTASPVAGQETMDALAGLVGGAFQYDLDGTGTVPFGGIRLTLPMHRWVLLEPALTYAAYENDAGANIPLLIPEAQVQGRWTLGRVDPFVGVGLGGVFDLREDRGGKDLVVSTLSAAAGARARLGRGWSARAELRVRGVDDFAGSAAEWTLGIARAF